MSSVDAKPETIEFTADMLRLYKEAYEMAREAGKDQFVFGGHPWLVSYAKFMIEYQETRFSIRAVQNSWNS